MTRGGRKKPPAKRGRKPPAGRRRPGRGRFDPSRGGRPPGPAPRREPLHLVATTSLGLEELVAEELKGLGARTARIETGAVSFRGSWKDGWRAVLRLRVANRVLVRCAEFPAPDDAALAAGVGSLVEGDLAASDLAGVALRDLLRPERALAFRATSRRSRLRDVRWIAQRAKDGLVDAQRRVFGARSSVDRDRPDLPLRILLSEDRATVLLDLAGDSLDKRGYRVRNVDAPMRENLAAACVLAGLEGWEGEPPTRVVDPMCGSGTLLIEAAWILMGRPPSDLRRTRWPFESWPGFDARRFEGVRKERVPALGRDVALLGMDRAPEAVSATRANLSAAGLADRADVKIGDAFEIGEAPGERGLLVVNPSWGERLAEGGEEDWRRLGDLLKQRFAGWRAVILAGDPGKGKYLGLKPSRRIPVRQGPVDARILVVDLY